MSLHINRFIDRVKAADARRQRDITMTMADARDLHADITKLLLVLHQLQSVSTTQDQPVQIEIEGGTF